MINSNYFDINEAASLAAQQARRDGIIGRYVDLMLDRQFKRVFGQEANKDLLTALLREILPELDIRELTLLNVEQQGLGKEGKNSTFDVCCTTGDGKEIIVEVQVKKQEHFADRALYYATLPLHRMLKKGEKLYRFMPVYVVTLLGFELDHTDEGAADKYEWRYSIREDKCGELLTDTLNFVFVELCKFNKTEEELCSLKEMWYFCLKHMDSLTEKPAALQAAVFKRLFDITEVESMPAEDQINYIKSMTTERDIYNQIAYARKEGKVEGIAEGVAQGKAEIARNLLAAGVDIKIIASSIGLTE